MTDSLFFSLKRHIGAAVFAGLVFAAIGFGGLFLFGRGYVAHSDFLLVQANAGNQDFYTSFKSSEYLSKVLGEAVGSERFVEAALATGKMGGNVLPPESGKAERLSAWRDMISVSRDESLGMISLTVKNENDRDAYRVLQAAGEVLMTQNALFRGGDEKSVEVRLLSGPIVERSPDGMTLALMLVFPFLLGASSALVFGVWKDANG